MYWLLFFALVGPLSGRVVAPANAPSHGEAAVLQYPSVQVDESTQAARKRFIAGVTNGRLKDFDEERDQVVFRPAAKEDSSHRPGPLEDDVIASTLRSYLAQNSAFQKLGLRVRSDSGRVQVKGAPNDPAVLAKLIVLALDIDGVTGVRADLPPGLRVKF